MKFKNNPFLNIFLFFSTYFILSIEVSNAQDLALAHADSFYNLGNYEQAITEYKRFIYFNPGHEKTGNIYFKLALSWRNAGISSKAIDAISESITWTYNDSIQDDRRISIGILYLASGKYSTAEFELLRVAHFSDYQSLRKKAYFFLGVCYLYLFDWKESQTALKHHFTDSLSQINIDSLFTLLRKCPHKSPARAKWLSTFLPGTGQAYCGDWRNGINAFTLNSLLGYALLNSLVELNFLDIFFSTYPFFKRYYTGNRDNSEMIAKFYNENNNKRFAKKILQQLQQQVKKD